MCGVRCAALRGVQTALRCAVMCAVWLYGEQCWPVGRVLTRGANRGVQCLQMIDEFKGAKGGMESKFNEKACECMGCCQPEGDKPPCFFPVWTFDQMLKGEGS